MVDDDWSYQQRENMAQALLQLLPQRVLRLPQLESTILAQKSALTQPSGLQTDHFPSWSSSLLATPSSSSTSWKWLMLTCSNGTRNQQESWVMNLPPPSTNLPFTRFSCLQENLHEHLAVQSEERVRLKASRNGLITKHIFAASRGPSVN